MPSWLADGKVDWNDIQGIPPGFADNVDNDRYRYTIPWTSITGIPPGFADGIDNVGGSPPPPTPPTLVTRTVKGTHRYGRGCSQDWQDKRLNCPSEFSAVSCNSRLSGGGDLDDHGDGDRHKCEVKSDHCIISCREETCRPFFACRQMDMCECEVSGSCTCQGYE